MLKHVTTTNATPNSNQILTILVSALCLTACGGGGGGGGASSTIIDTGNATNNLTISGTAATGLAIAQAKVEAKCQSGAGDATTAANGTYELIVNRGALPCVVKVTQADGSQLHSVAVGTGSTVTANITPLTELVVAKLSGYEPASFYTYFDATKATSGKVDTAYSFVRQMLASVLDLSAVGNPITDPLIAATSSGTTGNAHDGLLDKLKIGLAQFEISLSTLTVKMIHQPVMSDAATISAIAELLKPSASTCSSLRSGTYRVIDAMGSTLTVDAVKLNYTDSTGSGTLSSTGSCTYTASDGKTLLVSPSGVLIWRTAGTSTQGSFGIAVPNQTLTLPDIVGDWNMVSSDTLGVLGGPRSNTIDKVKISTDGSVNRAMCSTGAATCSADTHIGQLSVNASQGGYNFASAIKGNNAPLRWYAYRSPEGGILLATQASDGSMYLLTPVYPASMPVDAIDYGASDLIISASGSIEEISHSNYKITDYSGLNNSYTHWRLTDGSLNTFYFDQPRTGLLSRRAGTTLLYSGSTVATDSTADITAIEVLTFSGMGFSASMPAGTTNSRGYLGLSVVTSTMPIGTDGPDPETLTVVRYQSYPLRAQLTLDSTGRVISGSYDFHGLADSIGTPCKYISNLNNCKGEAGNFGTFTAFPTNLTTAGSTAPTPLSTAADQLGYAFTGTLSGKVWTGTWTKVSTPLRSDSKQGTFSVTLAIN